MGPRGGQRSCDKAPERAETEGGSGGVGVRRGRGAVVRLQRGSWRNAPSGEGVRGMKRRRGKKGAWPGTEPDGEEPGVWVSSGYGGTWGPSDL